MLQRYKSAHIIFVHENNSTRAFCAQRLESARSYRVHGKSLTVVFCFIAQNLPVFILRAANMRPHCFAFQRVGTPVSASLQISAL